MSSYAPTNWQDYPSLATAISAARLNNMESGIQAAYRVGTGGLTNADIANGAAIAYSKLALTGQIVNADIAAAAAISYSKLQLAAAILNSDIANAAAIDLHKLNIPNDATKVALGDGTWGAPPAGGGGTVGSQLDYAQITANVTTTTATEAAPLTVVQGNSVSYDGSPLIIDFCSSYVLLQSSASSGYSLWDMQGTPVQIGRIGHTTNNNAATIYFPALMKKVYTPSAGLHQFAVRVWGNAGVLAGAGGPSVDAPTFLRVTKA